MTGTKQEKRIFTVALLTGAICFVVFLRALTCDFVNLDDPEYVVLNTGIRSLGPDFWHWSWLTMPLNYWTPLLWISFALDYRFWGLNPLGYHLTNIVLHALTAFLFVIFSDKVYEQSDNAFRYDSSKYLYPGMLLTAGLLFAIHPARVESVVWITERKDVLNGVFTLGFLISYLHYLQRKNTARNGRGAYLLSLAAFILSMLIKPSGFMLPFALLVLDWYPLKRFRHEKAGRLLLEKIPFLAVGAAIVSVSILLRAKQGGFNTLADFPLAVRGVAAGNSLLEYFVLMVFPVNILPYDILPRAVPVVFIYKAVAALLLLIVTVLAAKRFPSFASAVMFFVITITPSLHFLTDGYQTVYSPRLTYLPSLLACVLAAPALVSVSRKIAAAAGKFGVLCTACLFLGFFGFYAATTVALTGDWKNSGVMWSKVIAHNPFDKAYFFRGSYLAQQGDYSGAIRDYSECLRLGTPRTLPDIHNVYAYRGEALAKAGYLQDAVNDFSAAISLYPHPIYYYHRGKALQALGSSSEADADFAAAGEEKGDLHWLQ